MCKVEIHLCNHVLIPTLALFPGRRVNSESWAVTTESGPALPSLISTGSSPVFVTTVSSYYFFFSSLVMQRLWRAYCNSRLSLKQLMVPQSSGEN